MSSSDPDVNTLLNELVNTVSEGSMDIKESHGSGNPSSTVEVSDFVEISEGCYLANQIEPSLRHQKKFIKKKIRSVSECQPELESQTQDVRRKFGSEGEIFSISEKIFPLQQQKDLNEAIEKYINKLIKDSIFKATQNVNVNNLYEDVIKDISNRKNSECTESEEEYTVEQRLSSNSISELVELENAGYSDNEKNDNRHGSLHSEYNEKVSETESVENEVDEVSFGGYLADLDDTASVDDLKSIDSLNSSSYSGLGNIGIPCTNNDVLVERPSCNVDETVSFQKTNDQVNTDNIEAIKTQNVNNVDHPEEENVSHLENCITVSNKTNLESEDTNESKVDHELDTKTVIERQLQSLPDESTCEQDQEKSSDKVLSKVENSCKPDQGISSAENINENVDLISMSEEESLLLKNNLKTDENKVNSLDLDESLLQPKVSDEERMKVNWKVGNIQVKLPHKTRGKTHLKAWKKRRVVIQPDEFVNDPKNPSLVISVYGSDSKKHETTFWYSVSSSKAVVFRSSSRTHRYAFTISEGDQPIIHLSAENETTTQEWMAAIRAVLWPPSPFMELEKMLNGREFEVSIIDNEFSYHCGLLGMYGYLSITPKKLILIHPQQGYVIQEWYLNTVDKFQFLPQHKTQDEHKVICMSTCSDSSTGQGDILFFCSESVTLLQSLASCIHQVLSYHSKQEGGKYQKELEEMAEWLVAPPQDCLKVEADEHYKVPPRQVKSLLDIPNFIFNKSLSPVTSAIYPAPNTEIMEPLDANRSDQTTASHDSGISTSTSGDDFLNCSVTSFIIGGGPMTGKSSDSELSDAYTPPRTPEVMKRVQCEVVKEEQVLDEY